jgi:succinylglutamate desuccinylase
MAPMQQSLRHHLDTFRALRSPGPLSYDWAHSHDGGLHDQTVTFQALTHGDEVGPLAGMLDVMAALGSGKVRFGGRARFVLGNPEAALLGRRFVEWDLNRVFVDDYGIVGGSDTHEARRARALMPLLADSTLFIDFHQTSEPSRRPFYSYPWRPDWAEWTRAIGGDTAWTTRAAGAVFVAGMRCTDEYVRDLGGMGMTLELGQRGFTDDARTRARDEMLRAMALLDALATNETTLADAAATRPAPELFAVVHIEGFSDPHMALSPGWSSFAPVSAGQMVSAPGTPPVRASADGAMLFPVYPTRTDDGAVVEPRPQALFRIIRTLDDPTTL